jgi:uroporphyrinogen-III synthase
MKLISTKKLSNSQRELLLEIGPEIDLIDYDAIKIEPVEFDNNLIIDNGIITSQNAAKIIIDNKVLIKNCFCVGEKTKALLESNGINVVKVKRSSEELAKSILRKCKNEDFWYFCGNLRREELPSIIKDEVNVYREIVVYNTSSVLKKVDLEYKDIIFCSPSAVESFTKDNSLEDCTAYCIGETTAKEAEKHTKEVLLSNEQNLEELLKTTVKHLKRKCSKTIYT